MKSLKKRCIFPGVCAAVAVLCFLLLFPLYAVSGEVAVGVLFAVPPFIFFGIWYLARRDIIGSVFTVVSTAVFLPLLCFTVRITVVMYALLAINAPI